MTPTGLIDEAVHVLKARPRTIITIAACFTVPVGIIVGFLQRGLLGGFSLGDILNDPSTADAASRSDGGTSAALLAILLPSIFLPFMAAAYAHVVVGLRLGQEDRRGRGAAASMPPLVAATRIVGARPPRGQVSPRSSSSAGSW